MVTFCKGIDPTTREPRTSNDFDPEDNSASCEPPPPQVDGGKDAWCFLAAVFLFEAVIWGFPYTFGIFQEYYMSHPLFSGSSGISAIGSTALGLITVPGLIGCQGVLFAVGSILAYFPGMQIIDQWFVKRRATAFAFVWAAAPLAGAVIPFAMQWLLDTYSFRTALRVYAVTVIVLLSPAAYFIKPPLPEKKRAATPCLDFAFFKHPCLWWYMAGTFMQSFGFFLPSLWIPTFATDYNFPSVAGPLALALYNASAFMGTVAQGWLVDRYHVRIDLAIATVLSAIAIFVFWGLATIQPIFYIFAILWGVSGGAYNATWAGYAFDLKAEGFEVDTTFIISLMVTAKGVASITSGPMSEVLYGLDLGEGAGFAYGGPYAAMIIYTGLCSLLGGVACLKPRKRRVG